MQVKTQKKILYVGGLPKQVDEKILYNVFIPFGEISEVKLPKEEAFGSIVHKGFGFIEFEDPVDARHAFENLHNSELFNCTIKVSYARIEEMQNELPMEEKEEEEEKNDNNKEDDSGDKKSGSEKNEEDKMDVSEDKEKNVVFDEDEDEKEPPKKKSKIG